MVYGEPIHKMSALAAPVGGMALEDFNVHGVATSWALGVASVARAIPATASRRRHPLELPRGMQRPFRLRKAYGATGRLGSAATFHQSLLTCVDANT